MNPREIGSLLFSHPEVSEVCVLTAPRYHAFVELAANAAVTLESLRALCDGHGAQAEGLGITVLDQMPKTRTGAVDRNALAALAEVATSRKHVA